jgi:DNA-binding Lrp family transcriptional regulator
MALTGTLGDFPVPDVFQLISLQKKTGYLTLKASETEVVTITFLEGTIVGADSLSKRLEERLGNVLVKSGKLTKEELAKALEIQKKTLQRLGHILVTEGFIERETLKNALAIQMQQTIFRLFRWKTGEYNFEPQDKVEWDKDNVEPMSTESIMMEGVRIVDEWPLIEKKIPSFDIVFEKVPLPQHPIVDEREESSSLEDAYSGFGEFGTLIPKKEVKKGEDGVVRLSQNEMMVYQKINGILTVQELIDHSGLSEFDTCKALFELLNRQLIKQVAAPIPEEEEVKKKFSVLRGLGAVGMYILIIWVIVSVLLIPIHPLDYYPSSSSSYIKDHHVVATRILIHRVQHGVWIYQMFYNDLPEKIEKVSEEGILPLDALKDASGRPIIYNTGEDGYTLAAQSKDGSLMDDLSLFSAKVGD